MRDAARRTEEPGAGPRYPARLLVDPELDERGVLHGAEGARSLLPWSEVRWAVAAEVGEPEGVRTIVFDLLAEDALAGFAVLRLDADPGGDAMELARGLTRGLGAERKLPSVRSLATDGIPARWYPDLESFEEEALAELRARVAADA